MIIARNPAELKHILDEWSQAKHKLCFVPTMGALHEGHLSLIDHAKTISDKVLVSIFINPTQFAQGEDFNSYPRQENEDLKNLKSRKTDLVYLPQEKDIYPESLLSSNQTGNNKSSSQSKNSSFEQNPSHIVLETGPAALGLETNYRAHFFTGVLDVISRLLDQCKPDTMLLGEKDFQQYQVIKEAVLQKDLSVQVISSPTIRDEHGLALSSRNAYLQKDELEIARTLNKVLHKAAYDKDFIKAKHSLLEAGFTSVDYIEQRWERILAAAWIGSTRLIDNVALSDI